MNKPCRRCRFHRELSQPLTQRLQAELSSGEVQLVEALTRMSQQEGERLDAETSQVVEVSLRSQSQWGMQPLMTSYCGLDEGRDVFYVARLKNPRNECDDFEERAPGPKQECATCRHCVAPTGPEEDRAHFAKLRRMAATAIALGEPRPLGPMEELRGWITTIKVREATQAFQGRALGQRPRYLSICGKHSQGSTFVPCAVHNAHDACPDWTPAAAAGTASPARGWALIGRIGGRRRP
jgi:hypothetical protein